MNKVQNFETGKKSNFWFNLISVLFGVIGVLFSVYTFTYEAKADLNYYLLTNTSVFDVKENMSNLTITYDSINIIRTDQNISILLVEVRNDGDKNIAIEDYDPNSPIGLKISHGKLLKKPEIIGSSDNNYFKNVILKSNNQDMTFKLKFIDASQFFRVKLMVLHNKNDAPSIIPFGKILGMDKIEVKSILKQKKEDKYAKLIVILAIALISILSLLSLSFYKISLLRKSYSNAVEESLEFKTLYASLSNEVSSSKRNILEFDAQPDNLGDQLSLDEKINLQPNDTVFHERFGTGKVIKVDKNINLYDSVAEIKFSNGIKRVMIKFVSLYRINL